MAIEDSLWVSMTQVIMRGFVLEEQTFRRPRQSREEGVTFQDDEAYDMLNIHVQLHKFSNAKSKNSNTDILPTSFFFKTVKLSYWWGDIFLSSSSTIEDGTVGRGANNVLACCISTIASDRPSATCYSPDAVSPDISGIVSIIEQSRFVMLKFGQLAFDTIREALVGS